MHTQASLGALAVDDSHFGAATNSGQILLIENLRKTFRSGSQEITPLDGFDLSIERGEMIAIVGPSGA